MMSSVSSHLLIKICFLFELTHSIIYVDRNTFIPLSNQTGKTWFTAFKLLQHALLLANDHDEIWIAHGIYTNNETSTPFVINNNYLRLYGGFLGNETHVNERYLYNVTTVLSGNNEHGVITMTNKNNCLLDGLVIENGSTFNYGGGFYTSYCNNITINNIDFNHNVATLGGGGFYTTDCDNIIINNIRFNHNTASDCGGGLCAKNSYNIIINNARFNDNAVYFSGGGLDTATSRNIIINNTSFNDNTAKFYGGGFHLWKCDNITINNTFFNDNTAQFGGGLHTQECDYINIISTHVYHNIAKSEGGGVWILRTRNIFINNTVINHNSANNGGGLYTESDWYIIINNTIFNNNTADVCGGGLYSDFTHYITINNTVFNENTANEHGGGLYNADRNDMSIINTYITHNTANKNGGGLYSVDATDIMINNILFNNNIAHYYGGALYTIVSHNMTINNTQFNDNTAKYYGGGLYIEDSTDMIINNVLFNNNTAKYYGGGLYIEDSTDMMINNIDVDYNTASAGAGLYTYNCNVVIINNTLFNYNVADYEGGGLYTHYSTTVVITKTQFVCNTAVQQGGGLYVHESVVSVANSVFKENAAVFVGGGGVSVVTRSLFVLESITSSLFVANHGQIGGAILITDRGSVKLCNKSSAQAINVIDSNFSKNVASIGAVVYVDSSCSSIIINTSNLFENHALNGGAVVLDITSDLSQIIQDTIFNSNMVTYNGGSIFIYQSKLEIKSCNMSYNRAGQHGGAIYMSSSYLAHNKLYLNNCDLNSNTAGNNGGAIFIEEAASVIFNSSIVKQNVADNSGGALYLYGECYIFDSVFSNNIASNEGGCGSVQNEALLHLYNTDFINCSCDGIGGALFSISNNIAMSFVSFESNAASGGGAVYFSKCPYLNNNNLWFQKNLATFGGGAAVINDEDCDVNWCKDCSYENNVAAYGNNISSLTADLINPLIEFDIPLKVHQQIKLNVSVVILDSYQQIMEDTDYTMVVSMQKGVSMTDVALNGVTDQTIKNGLANLSFWITPNENIRFKSIALNITLQLNIISPNYERNYTTNLLFHNTTYKTPEWLCMQCYILFSIIAILNMIIARMLLKNLYNTIIHHGISLYLSIILFGTCLLSLSLIVLIINNLTDVWCQIIIWIFHLSLVLIIGPLGAKVFYTWKCTFFSDDKFEGYDAMNLKLFTIIYIVTPLIICITYLTSRMWIQKSWSYWEVDEISGTNTQFCRYNDMYMVISGSIAILILLWMVQISLNIEDKKGEY
eukprot:497759_1